MPALSQNLIFHTTTGTNTVIVDYPNTPEAEGTLSFVSDKVKGDGYFGGSDGVHTVMYTISPEFAGTVTMQATLATMPEETDWFNVAGTVSTYPDWSDRSTSTVDLYTFTGNYVWVRGQISIDRGVVSSIRYNH
jgi:hypothetical protein